MSEGVGSGAQGASAGQAAGNTAGQNSESTSGEQSPQANEGQPSGGGEAAVGTSAEATTESFDKAGTDTMNHQTKEVVGDDKDEVDDYVPIRDYIRNQYKDEQFEDDDKVDRKAYRHIKDLEGYREKNRDANKKVMTLFNAHPELVGALQDMDAGADFTEALALNLSPEQKKTLREVILADDYKPQNEKWAEEKTKREQKFTERQKWTESYESNRKMSADNLKTFATEKGLDQPALEQFAKTADELMADVYNGKIGMPFLNMIYTALNADKDKQQAVKVAEVKAKNEAIKEKVTKVDPVGDGLPDLSKGGETKEKPKMSDSDAMLTSIVDTFNARNERFK